MAAVVVVVLGAGLLIANRGGGRETVVVESPSIPSGTRSNGVPAGGPAAAVEFPVSARSAADSSAALSGTAEGQGRQAEPASSRSESSGSHTEAITGPDGSGLEVTNSGTATADSGANAGSGSTDGTGTNLQTGPTEAQGNNSTTEINR